MPTFSFGDWLRKARKDAHLGQSAIADACGVSRPLVSRWERDESTPSVEDLRRIIQATGAEWLVEYVLGHELAA